MKLLGNVVGTINLSLTNNSSSD